MSGVNTIWSRVTPLSQHFFRNGNGFQDGPSFFTEINLCPGDTDGQYYLIVRCCQIDEEKFANIRKQFIDKLTLEDITFKVSGGGQFYITITDPAEIRGKGLIRQILHAINSIEKIQPESVYREMHVEFGLSDDAFESLEKLVLTESVSTCMEYAKAWEKSGASGVLFHLGSLYFNANKLDDAHTVFGDLQDKARLFELVSKLLAEEDLPPELQDFTLICADLCDERLKSGLFAERCGKAFDPDYVRLAEHLHGKGLAEVARELHRKNEEIAALRSALAMAEERAHPKSAALSFAASSSVAAAFEDDDASVVSL